MSSLDHLKNAFEKADWMIPPYVSLGFLSPLGARILKNPDHYRTEALEKELGRIYSPDGLSAMVAHRYHTIHIVKDFKSIISESVEAHFLGLDHVAVTGLLPVVEGIGHRLAKQQKVRSNSKDILPTLISLAKKCQSDAFSRPIGAADEISSMMESFITFSEKVLYRSSRNITRDGANRHAIFHGEYADKDFGRPIDFYKVMTTIDFLTFMSSAWNGGSFLSPSPTAQSQEIAAYYRVLSALAVFNNRMKTVRASGD